MLAFWTYIANPGTSDVINRLLDASEAWTFWGPVMEGMGHSQVRVGVYVRTGVYMEDLSIPAHPRTN